jgi:hypothetical protein
MLPNVHQELKPGIILQPGPLALQWPHRSVELECGLRTEPRGMRQRQGWSAAHRERERVHERSEAVPILAWETPVKDSFVQFVLSHDQFNEGTVQFQALPRWIVRYSHR